MKNGCLPLALLAILILVSCQNSAPPTAVDDPVSTDNGTIVPPSDKNDGALIDEPTIHRDIEDFTNAQGTTSNWQAYGDQMGWAGPAPDYPYGCIIDYAGIAAAYLLDNYDVNLGTEVSGDIVVRSLRDGRHVQVNLHATNCLAWVINAAGPWGPPDPTYFGAYADDVGDGATPGLADLHFTWTFRDAAEMDDPIPDLVVATWFAPPEGYVCERLCIRANGTGPLHEGSGFPEGSNGHLTVSQTGNMELAWHSPNYDGWPAEVVRFNRVGN